MTCAELQQELPELLENGTSAKYQAHLKTCDACSELLGSLQTIIRGAHMLQAADEPSPRVWNSIEIALRREGLIRSPQEQPSFVSSFARRWGIAAWLVPAAAALLVGTFVFVSPQLRIKQPPQQAVNSIQLQVTSNLDSDDQQLLEELNARAPFMEAAYEKELHNVNQYIRDAQDLVDANPNDEGAQQSLMDAYGQKAVIYHLALDRSLP
jgi:hypothetical protein